MAAAVAAVSIEQAVQKQQQRGGSHNNDDEEEEECPICLMDLGEMDGREALGACGHTFHWQCLGEWRDTCRRKELPLNCPYCRQKM